MKENGFWLTTLQNHFFNGDILLSLEDFKTLINSYSGSAIKVLANKYLDTKNYVQVALTPAPKTETK